jgi:hypothetical protein
MMEEYPRTRMFPLSFPRQVRGRHWWVPKSSRWGGSRLATPFFSSRPILDQESAVSLYLSENTGSRPLSPSHTRESQISSWVGVDQRIPGVVCF